MYFSTVETVFALFCAFFAISNGFPSSTGENEIKPNIDEQGIWFEGDILGFSEKNGDIRIWPNKTIIYTIDKKFGEHAIKMIHGAMDEISDKTCIHFKKRTTEVGFAEFYSGLPGTGCSAYVGKMDRHSQPINLAPTCIHHGIIIHEIMHTLGFYHEQSRADRDDYVNILYENILPGREYNFDKYSKAIYGVPYDYDSLLHYSKYAFSKNGLPTIITTPHDVPIGQRNGMSPSDALKVNLMYKC